MLPQDTVEAVRKSNGKEVAVRFYGEFSDQRSSQVQRVVPQATLNLPHEAFAAVGGGALTTIQRATNDPNQEETSL